MIGLEIGTPSHVNYLFEICKDLQQKYDHTIYYISHDYNQKFSKGYNVTNLVLERDMNRVLKRESEIWGEAVTRKEPKTNEIEMYSNILGNLLLPNYELSLKSYFKLFKEYEPDLVICDFMSTACLDAAESLNLPIIHGFQTVDLSFPFLNSPYISPSQFHYTPTQLYELDYYERIYYTFINKISKLVYLSKYIIKLDKIRQRNNINKKRVPFGPFNHLKLFNTFHGLEVNRPLDQSVKMIGPIIRTSTQVQPLDKKIVKFLKLRKRIVYVSFGTIFYPPNSEFKKLLKGLLNLVEKGEIDGVIIANKYLLNNLSLLNIHSDLIEDTIDLLNHPAFLLVEYLNQKEILNQQQIKLFVSHGGLMSLFESIHYSKPMLLLPLSVDQPRNARKAVEMGIGIYMDPFNSELKEYSSNIMTIINDKDNTFDLSLKRANLLSKQNENGIDTAINYIQQLLNLKLICQSSNNLFKWINNNNCIDSHFQLPQQNLSLYQRYLLDIYLPILLSFSLFSYLLYKTISNLLNLFFIKKKTKVE